MSRTLRIVLFGGVALAAWCFSSDKLLSRVATDDGDEPAAQAAADAPQEESDYQVVKLLSKLFTSIKRNHVEVLNLHRQYARSTDPAERADVKRQMQDRIAFVETKAHEYAQLVPSLQQSYPGLKSVIQSFSRDLRGISGDLELIKQTDAVGHRDVATADARRRAPREQGDTAQVSFAGRPEAARPEEADAQGGMITRAAERERQENPEPGAAGGGVEMTPNGMVVPITLQVAGADGQKIDKRKIVFQVADNKRGGMKGFVDQGGLVSSTTAYTDDAGRAVVKLQMDPSDHPVKIKRTIIPREDQTVCLLESVE